MESNFITPCMTGFSIFSKSGCHYCLKVKNLLKENNLKFDVIDCDEYLIENRENFLNFIKELAGKEVKTFPMIFYGGKFIGGFSETQSFVNKILSFEDNFEF